MKMLNLKIWKSQRNQNSSFMITCTQWFPYQFKLNARCCWFLTLYVSHINFFRGYHGNTHKIDNRPAFNKHCCLGGILLLLLLLFIVFRGTFKINLFVKIVNGCTSQSLRMVGILRASRKSDASQTNINIVIFVKG